MCLESEGNMKLNTSDKVAITFLVIVWILLIYVLVDITIQEHKYDTLEELKPCPFCGNADIEIEEERIIKYFDDGTLMCDLTVVEYDNCGAEITSSLKHGEPHAKELWNRRKCGLI